MEKKQTNKQKIVDLVQNIADITTTLNLCKRGSQRGNKSKEG